MFFTFSMSDFFLSPADRSWLTARRLRPITFCKGKVFIGKAGV